MFAKLCTSELFKSVLSGCVMAFTVYGMQVAGFVPCLPIA